MLVLGKNFKTSKKTSRYTGVIITYWNSRCQTCRAEESKSWRQRNPEKVSKYYQEIDRYRVVERNRVYRERHPERAVEILTRYRQTEQGKIKHCLENLRRYYQQRKAPGVFTKEQIDSRIEYYGGKCWICKGPFNTMDHVIPIARGGSNWASNQRPICTSCNSCKGARLVHKGDSIPRDWFYDALPLR